MDDIREIIRYKAREIFDEAVRLRRHFHKYPELSFKEYKTSEFISAYLTENNIDYVSNIAGTGIIAQVQGKKGPGRVIALRAEMDALPINENSGREYASDNKGIMHACGHDAHMAMLLSAAIILNDISKHFGGKIAFIFQPGEELAPGGAKMLMETSTFKKLKPDLLIAQHVLPGLKTGLTGFRAGEYMASSNEIHISIHGRGGHAARPDQYTDQVLIGSELVIKLKEAVKEAHTGSGHVFSIGRFSAEGATNIIPSLVNIQGTVRTYDEKTRKDILKIINDVCISTGNKHRVNIHLDIPEGYPVLVNDKQYTLKSAKLAGEINGHDRVIELEQRMSAEDFAHFSRKYPVVFFRTGIMSGKKGSRGLHTADFTIDEKAMETGIRTMAYLAVNFV
ncbi:MAG: amidohydrolase [Bacteroidales bacterium]|nr:amidohydrolase [Bacteroidales bacterium]